MTNDDISCFLYFSVIPSKKSRCFWLSNSGGLMQAAAKGKTKPIREGLKAQKSEKARAAYRQANESDFIIAEAAARYFKAQGLTKLPGRKALQAEIEQLISEKDGLYNTYHEQKQRFRELQTVKRNIDQILRREEPHRRKEQSHER